MPENVICASFCLFPIFKRVSDSQSKSLEKCINCLRTNKYRCIGCKGPVCIRYPVLQEDESVDGYIVRKLVGFYALCPHDYGRHQDDRRSTGAGEME